MLIVTGMQTKQAIKVCHCCGVAFQPPPKAKKGTFSCSQRCRTKKNRMNKKKQS